MPASSPNARSSVADGYRRRRMWLVDGNNVMGARADGWWRDRHGAMQWLVNALDDVVEAGGDEVAVVFDGPERDLQAVRTHVAFAPHADDAIAARARPGTTVVTSDRELASRARANGADVLGAGAFLRRL
ncbi:MAG TPA: NYN domain-containing protein [Solirubrobacteraceae bacterium]|nr:NYN domain-containing protein [Solirubrobacteraceae bacterium]